MLLCSAPQQYLALFIQYKVGVTIMYQQCIQLIITIDCYYRLLCYCYFHQGTFAIHPETGSLTVADVLDWESRHSYVLVIEAWDNYQFGYTAGESRNAFKQIQYVIS